MAKCFRPWTAYQSIETGSIFMHEVAGSRALRLPCGNCVGCRLGRAQQWALRCRHELSLHMESSFITLTYSDEFLPEGGTLRYKDVQLHFKRLRKRIGSFRYFLSGEYGSRGGRPHYHYILFGHGFHDRRRFPVSKVLFGHPDLLDSWSSEGKPMGSANFGAVTPQSISYVTGYVTRKQTQRTREYKHLARMGKVPPFSRMSLRPAIGKSYFETYLSDFYHGNGVYDGREIPLPRYYRERMRVLNPHVADVIDEEAAARAELIPLEERSGERLRVGEAVTEARLKFFSSGKE